MVPLSASLCAEAAQIGCIELWILVIMRDWVLDNAVVMLWMLESSLAGWMFVESN
jgi:hypothetical protein